VFAAPGIPHRLRAPVTQRGLICTPRLMIIREAIGIAPPERPRARRDPRHRHLYRDHLDDQLPILVGPRPLRPVSETTHANHTKPTPPPRQRTGGTSVTTTTSCPSPCPARGPMTTAITRRLINMSADPASTEPTPPASSAPPTTKIVNEAGALSPSRHPTVSASACGPGAPPARRRRR
jgi:hypothetical protein